MLLLARQPNAKVDGLAGLDRYLIDRFRDSKPATLRKAMLRLDTAMQVEIQVRRPLLQ